MAKFLVKIEIERIVEAENESEADENFWSNWEDDCALKNSEIIREIAEEIEIRPATKEDLERLGEDE